MPREQYPDFVFFVGSTAFPVRSDVGHGTLDRISPLLPLDANNEAGVVNIQPYEI